MLCGLVYDIIATRAVDKALSTRDVAEIYNAAHPAAQQKTSTIGAALRLLNVAGHVDLVDGPRADWRYWTLPTTGES